MSFGGVFDPPSLESTGGGNPISPLVDKALDYRVIKHFEQTPLLEPADGGRFQLGPALGAGLIAGLVLLLVPRGSPWSGISFFSSVVMGRPVPPGVWMPLPMVCLVHLILAEVYTLIISWFVSNVTQAGAVMTGAVIGLVLYLINLAIVSVALPAWHGNEVAVLFTHTVFGLIAGGAYRGLLRRQPQRVGQ